jgi:transposase-like protein
MKKQTRRKFNPAFKAKVALEAKRQSVARSSPAKPKTKEALK